jgi:GDPmannose 4,6-dehydratase
MKPKRALITGITGQDGSYLAEFLIGKGYEVFGFVRRTSNDPFLRMDHLRLSKQVKILYGNLRDIAAIERAIAKADPDEIYNLAAQSHVGISFECPEETTEINYYGVGRLVNAAMRFNPKIKIYQASTSEMFGATAPPQNETSPFAPVSPYAEAKLKAHEDFVIGYRHRHGLFICSGFLFNHESPRRGENFVTRKITISLAKIKLGLQDSFELGNLDIKRDWGFAGDYVEAMWLMLQQPEARDFVIATGEAHSVREFVNETARALNLELRWEGKGVEEVARDAKGKVIIRVNPVYYRPKETNDLIGDSRRACEVLHWERKVDFKALVAMMADADLKFFSRLKTALKSEIV